MQVLQDGKFSRIGAQEDTRSEARVICATNRDLKQEIAAGTFREDLFYRVNVVNITLPSLRERSADIPGLVEYFRDHFNMMYNRKAPAVIRVTDASVAGLSLAGQHPPTGKPDQALRDSGHGDMHQR